MRHGRWFGILGPVMGVISAGGLLAACQVNVPTMTKLAASVTQAVVGQPVTFTATVSSNSGQPAGPVTFNDGATMLGTANLSGGTARLVTSALSIGSHQVTATYSATMRIWTSSTSAPVTVTVQASALQYFISMGDSLSAGVGAPAGQGYVDDILAHEQTRLAGLVGEPLGCSGATTTSMLRGGGCSYPQGTQVAAAMAFLQAHPGQVSFITIDIGANDITACFSGGAVNQSCALAALTTVQNNLATILADLRAAGASVPIFGMNYYDPFLAAWVTGGQAFAQQSEQLAVTGNAAITKTYLTASAQVADVQTAFDTTNFALTGTYQSVTVPQNVANICNWTLMCQSQNIHANAAGHQIIANAFIPLIDATV